ncbi:MAG TPA: hypothetical protein VF342_05040 [Alphaproteobacteria bacterium]
MKRMAAAATIDLKSKKEVELFRKAASAYTKKATVSKEAARKELVNLGIYTSSGRLTKNYK